MTGHPTVTQSKDPMQVQKLTDSLKIERRSTTPYRPTTQTLKPFDYSEPR